MISSSIRIGAHDGIRVIGDEPIILRECYHKDQLWFPFMAGTILASSVEEEEKPKKFNPHKKPPNKPHARMVNERIYDLNAAVEQYVLPYHEHRKVSNTEAGRLKDRKYPGFERNKDGDLYIIDYHTKRKSKQRVFEYCVLMCSHRFIVRSSDVIFERADDAALFTLFVA